MYVLVTYKMDNFYITLPSNTINNTHTNTASDFVIQLPQKLKLVGAWECGLCEILYPHNWETVSREDSLFACGGTIHNIKGEEQYELVGVNIPAQYYSTIEELVAALNFVLKENHFTTYNQKKPEKIPISTFIVFSYNSVTHRVSLAIKGQFNVQIYLPTRLQNMLGFKFEKSFTATKLADYAPDMLAGFESMYVYCNIIEPQVVGNVLAPLLRIVNIEGTHPNIVNKIYDIPHYVPVQIKDISEIEINIKTDTGDFIKFLSGKVMVKLHFRQVKTSYF